MGGPALYARLHTGVQKQPGIALAASSGDGSIVSALSTGLLPHPANLASGTPAAALDAGNPPASSQRMAQTGLSRLSPAVAVPRLRRRSHPPPVLQRAGARRDRKSTRLNSSHVAISYAVFCLKKKRR